MRRSVLICLLVLGVAPQGQAWKSKAYKLGIPLNSSAHSAQTERAVGLLQAHYPSNRFEWDVFQPTLVDASGTLVGDSNAHGNIIFVGEREDPEGSPVASGGLSAEAAIAYNGGPFYRYWIRAVEAHGQVCGDVDATHRRLQGSSGRPTTDTYRYFGYLAHLVEDQCVPAHACNIRHGPWEGVEWWHWQSGTSGGGGLADPLPVANLLPYMESLGWDNHYEFIQFWQDEKKHESDRGINKTKPGALHNIVHGFLGEAIKNTQDRWAPGLMSKLGATPYFNTYANGGHVLSELDLQRVWADEDRRSLLDYTPDNTNWIAFSNNLRYLWVIPPDDFNFYDTRPQFRAGNAADEGPGNLWIGDDPRILGNTLADSIGPYGQLNRNTAPWLPNPAYKGEAFDGRWGSYGGFWGIPGRTPVEGHYGAEANYKWDAATGQKGRITPGDLYTLHTGTTYDPDHPYTWPSGEIGYNDERSWAPIDVNQSLKDIGFEQINKAAMWSAVLLENLSKALPPRIVDLKMTNRIEQLPGWAKVISGITRPGWLSAPGAWIDLTVGVNRMDEYDVEFYAVPQAWFRKNDPSRWRRHITTGSHQSLWPSDITVNVANYKLSQDNNPPDNAKADSYGAFSRDYDFVYDQMPVIPLKVIKGKKQIQEASLYSPGANEPSASPVVIPASEVVTYRQAQEAADLLETDAYSFSQTFTWTGEVGNPKGLFSDTMPDGSGTASDYLKDPKATVKTLRDGSYFLLAVIYRKYWRDGFARNQFKILYPDKQVLEYGTWWSSVWNQDFFAACQAAGQRPSDAPMIPDELIPFNSDGAAPTMLAQ